MSLAASYSAAAGIRPEELIREHATLVKRIAYHLTARMPDSIDVEDLIQVGMVGLLEAAAKFDAEKGASFETFAGIRIRGAMLDEVRRHDWTPRSVHRKARAVTQAIRDVEARTGGDASAEDIARELGMSMAEYGKVLRDTSVCRLFSLEELVGDNGQQYEPEARPDADPLAQLMEQDLQQALATTIAGLSEREQLVMSLYYDDELNLREIGEVLGVSESRVCQIHGQALMRIRARVEDVMSRESEDAE